MPLVPPAPDFAREVARLEARARYAPRVHSRPAEKLAPLRRLLERLGRPERGPRVVHVAGTNGKGTTAAMVARLLQADLPQRPGARVGLYTSPHLVDIRERIRIQGQLIPETAFARAAAAVLDEATALNEGPDAFSWFDLITAIAFVAFREQAPDWLVLETGLGGTADSTNVTDKELAILTPIGHDHMPVLGGDLRAVAGQKQGIVPPGTPVVLAPQPPALADWMAEMLAAQGSRVLHAERIALSPTVEGITAHWPEAPPLDLPHTARPMGAPHLACVATALVAAEHLLGPARDDAERRARALLALETALPGRQQILDGAKLAAPPHVPLPRLVLDGAHNREALAALVASLAQWRIENYTLLLTLMEDKLVEAVREPLAALLAGARRVIAVRLEAARAPAPEALRDYLEALLPPGQRARVETAQPAAALALAAETPERPAVAAGSLWMVGELMKALHPPGPETVAEGPGRHAGEAPSIPSQERP